MFSREAQTEQEIRMELNRASIRREAKKGVWKTKDGTEIPIQKLSDSHLKNIFLFLEDRNQLDMMLPWLIRIEQELKRRDANYPCKYSKEDDDWRWM